MPSWKIAGPTKRFNANLGLACDTRLFRYHLEVIIPFDRPSRFGRIGAAAPGTQEQVLAAVGAGRCSPALSGPGTISGSCSTPIP